MPAPLSMDLRRRILHALQNTSATHREIAERFNVGVATVGRIARRYRETGSVTPKPRGGGRPPRITESDREQLLAWFQAEPNLTQQDIADRFADMGRPMSQQAVSRGLRRLGIAHESQ